MARVIVTLSNTTGNGNAASKIIGRVKVFPLSYYVKFLDSLVKYAIIWFEGNNLKGNTGTSCASMFYT